MIRLLFFLIFVFIFWFIHIIKRLFEHVYIWQVKEYRWDRIKAFLRESGTILKSLPTVIALLLTFSGVLLSRYIQVKWLYLTIVIGFGYYVYSTLVTFTKLLNKTLIHPKKSARNFLIISTLVLLSMLPVLASFLFYVSIYKEPAVPSSQLESAELVEIFPREVESGVITVPLETVTAVLLFKYLFIFDLVLPFLIALLVFFSSIFAAFVRKKK